MATDDEIQLLREAFEEVIHPDAVKHFGGNSGRYEGWHDGNPGVQWNTGIDRGGLSPYLGVNLEGMMYDGWPIARLIVREIADPRLREIIRQLRRPDEIEVHLWRDAWQASMRPEIAEGRIGRTPVSLRDLTDEEWRQALLEARSCLTEERGVWRRAVQTVTSLPRRRQALMSVSPHLQFRLRPWWRVPSERGARIEAMQAARERLQSIYDFVRERSAPAATATLRPASAPEARTKAIRFGRGRAPGNIALGASGQQAMPNPRPQSGAHGGPIIRSFPERTRRRAEEVSTYLRAHVLRDGAFVCPHHAACRASAESAGQNFYEGQLHHIGPHYDLEVDGRPTRIVIVGQEYGTAERRVGLAERSRMVEAWAQLEFRRRNPHMQGTTTTLRLLFEREPGADVEGEWIGGEVDAHVFDAFALVDFLLCSAVGREVRYDVQFKGSPRGRSTSTMQRNCGPHLVRVLELLEPTVIVVQGRGVRRWLAAPLGLRPEGPPVETVAVRGAPVALINLVHPSARSERLWGRSAESRYVRDIVRPTIRSLLEINASPGNPPRDEGAGPQ